MPALSILSMPKLFKLYSLVFFALAMTVSTVAQTSTKTAPSSSSAAEQAASLAESDHCPEALPALSRAAEHLTDKALQKRVGLDGARCATLMQQWNRLLDFVRILNREFPHDPEVLYVSIHAYTDLSSRSAQELAEAAPNSIPALEMDAEVNEEQGKWDRAENDYQKILAKDPRYPGIHFRLARILLSKPNPPAGFQDQAKTELQEELKIDPANAGAEYILGQLALQARDFDEAIQHLARATKLEPNFGAAYLGLGVSLSAEKKYQEAIAPLEMAVKLEPTNPAAYYSLGTAYSRTGHKAEAEQEFARQRAIEQPASQQGQNPQ